MSLYDRGCVCLCSSRASSSFARFGEGPVALPGRAGAVDRQLRLSSWALLRLVVASALGCRRRVRAARAVSSDSGVAAPPAGAAQPLAIRPGSAAEVQQRCADATREVADTLRAGLSDDTTVKYSQSLQVCML